MLNKKAQSNILGIIIAVLTIGLFFGFMDYMITNIGGDDTGYDETRLAQFNDIKNLSADIETTAQSVENAVVDKNAFDFFANIFDQVLRPFKFTYRSYKSLRTMSTYLGNELGLPSIFTEYFYAIITAIVIIGIVMIKFYMNRRKGG